MRAVIVIALIAALCACSRSTTTTHPNVLRVADIAEPDRFNPLLSTMDLTEELSALVYSTLVIANANGKLIGDLASEVPSLRNGGISADGKTYTYHLRPGVKWHDGAPFTSRDVAFTWRLVMDPRNNVLHREGYDEVSSIETPDELTVRVHLRRRSPPFVTRFFTSLQEGAKVILPEHLLASAPVINESPFNAAPVGTGPFKFVKWERGKGLEFVANENYFRGRPKLDKIVFTTVPDDNTILSQMRAHELDMVVSVPPTLFDQYKTIPGVVARTFPWNAESIVPLNSSRPGLRHLEVRQALARSIDYQAVIDKVTHGVGAIAHDIVPPSAIGFTNNPKYPYDPAGARKLLESNGWKLGADGVRAKGGERLDLVMVVTSGAANGRTISVLFQSWFKAIGVNLTIKSYPYNQIFAFDGPINTGKYDLASYSYTLPYDPDNLVYLGCDEFPHKGENAYFFCDRAVDAGEKAGLTTDDPAERARIYTKVEKRIRETVPYIPIYLLRRPVAYDARLQNFSAAPSIASWWNSYEWSF